MLGGGLRERVFVNALSDGRWVPMMRDIDDVRSGATLREDAYARTMVQGIDVNANPSEEGFSLASHRSRR